MTAWSKKYVNIIVQPSRTNYIPVTPAIHDLRVHVEKCVQPYRTNNIQHKAYFLIQLNADSLYPFAC